MKDLILSNEYFYVALKVCALIGLMTIVMAIFMLVCGTIIMKVLR